VGEGMIKGTYRAPLPPPSDQLSDFMQGMCEIMRRETGEWNTAR
jgi:hypothetical protein